MQFEFQFNFGSDRYKNLGLIQAFRQRKFALANKTYFVSFIWHFLAKKHPGQLKIVAKYEFEKLICNSFFADKCF